MPLYLAIFSKYFPFLPISSAHCILNPSENKNETKDKLTNYQLLWWLMHTSMLCYTHWNKLINLKRKIRTIWCMDYNRGISH